MRDKVAWTRAETVDKKKGQILKALGGEKRTFLVVDYILIIREKKMSV